MKNTFPQLTLNSARIDTPLGQMIAIADEHKLYFLQFADQTDLQYEIETLQKKTKAAVVPGITAPLRSIEKELKEYFNGSLKDFTTPMHYLGSPFQTTVWATLRKIPFNETRSYAEIAAAIGKPTAYRAVAQANGANKIVIAIPCHRVINSNGALGGYSCGLERKKWLLEHEKKDVIKCCAVDVQLLITP